LASIPKNSLNPTRINTSIDPRTAFKNKIAEKKQEQKTNKKTKNPIFVKISKFIFYLICLISLFIVFRKLMEKFGLTVNQVETSNNTYSKNKTTSNKNTDEIPLKQFEITEIKHEANKGD